MTRKRYWFTTLGAIVHMPEDFVRPVTYLIIAKIQF